MESKKYRIRKNLFKNFLAFNYMSLTPVVNLELAYELTKKFETALWVNFSFTMPSYKHCE
jgi:hypothetical protein